MTDHPTPSAEALAAADAICKRHGMLPGGYMRDSLAEDLEAFAAAAVAMSWAPRCGMAGWKAINGVCPEHGGDGCLMAHALIEARKQTWDTAAEIVWQWRDRLGGFEAQQLAATLRQAGALNMAAPPVATKDGP